MATAARTLPADVEQYRLPAKTLVIIGFVVTCMPLARVMIGSMPVYVLDMLIAACWGMVLLRRRPSLASFSPLPALAVVYGLFIVLSSVREGATYGAVLYPVYMVGRNLLGISLLLLVPMAARTPNDLARLLKGMVIGGLVTSLIGVGWALPNTSYLVRTYVFNSFLFPERAGLEAMAALDPGLGQRAQALVGGENMVGCFVLQCLPIAVAMWRGGVAKGWFRWVCIAALPLGLLGCALTYSRSTYLALTLCMLTTAFFGMFRIPRAVVVLGVVAAFLLVFQAAQQQSDAFRFDYVVGKIEAVAGDPNEQETDRARVLAYTELLPFLIENPTWLALGRGESFQKLRQRTGMSSYQQILQMRDARNHSAWASTLYNRGFIAVLLLLAMVVIVGLRVWSTRQLAQIVAPEWNWLGDAYLLVFVAIVPFFMVTSFLATSTQGQALAFLTFGAAGMFRAFVLARAEERHG